MAIKINTKYEYCGYTEKSSDKDFLGFIYTRLNQVFGEPADTEHMKRLEALIEKTSGKIRIGCDCSPSDECPQGRESLRRCSIWKET